MTGPIHLASEIPLKTARAEGQAGGSDSLTQVSYDSSADTNGIAADARPFKLTGGVEVVDRVVAGVCVAVTIVEVEGVVEGVLLCPRSDGGEVPAETELDEVVLSI